MNLENKKKAIELRKSGKSYNAISEDLNIPKSTICEWLKNEEWSKKITAKNISKVNSRGLMIKMNEARAKKLMEHYDDARREATSMFLKYKDEPLFTAGLMLYAGEGDKSMANHILRLSNIDPEIIKIFKLFLNKYFKDRNNKIRFWVLAYPDLNISNCEKFWLETLSLQKSQFYKTQIIEGRHKQKRLIYGVGNIIINEKYLKVLIVELIRLFSEDLIKHNMRM